MSGTGGKQHGMAVEDGQINALLVLGKERVKETRFIAPFPSITTEMSTFFQEGPRWSWLL